jgi:hypothetical protein
MLTAFVLAAGTLAASALPEGRAHTSRSHTISVNEGIPGASVGDSEAFVKSHLGKPGAVYQTNCTTPKKCDQEWAYPNTKRYVEFHHDTVLFVIFNSPKDVLTDGIGVGVSRSKVQRAYSHCPTKYSYCFLRSDGTRKDPKVGKKFTYARLSGTTHAEKVDAVIVGVWEPRYEDCMLGCG